MQFMIMNIILVAASHLKSASSKLTSHRLKTNQFSNIYIVNLHITTLHTIASYVVYDMLNIAVKLRVRDVCLLLPRRLPSC